MSYQEFLDEVVQILREMYPTCTVEITDVTKINNIPLKGLVIREQNTNIAPTIYMEGFYKCYKWNWKMEDIIQKIKLTYEETVRPQKLDLSFFRDFTLAKERIVYRLINAEQNKELLQKIPHRRFWDLAICYSYAFHSEELGDGTILIHNSHMSMWQVDEDELMKVANVNTPVLFPVELNNLTDTLHQMAENLDEKLDLDELGDVGMFVLTNKQKTHGAAVMLYPETMDLVTEIIRRDFFVLPSSVHEVLLLPVRKNVPVDEQIKDVCKLVSEANRNLLKPEEILTDNPFLYNYKEKTLRQLVIEIESE